MHIALSNVLDFHQKMGLSIGDPRYPDISVDTQLRYNLIHEEFTELGLALEGVDKDGNTLSPDEKLIAVADALGDIAYTIAGAAATWGIDLGGVFDAIHTSNMTKSPANKRADGKILKGPEYVPPDIAGVFTEAAQETDVYGFGQDAWWPEPTVKAMQEIPRNASAFVETHHLPAELAAKLLEAEPRDSKPVNAEPLNGVFNSWGYIFDCLCGRTQSLTLREGSRGGFGYGKPKHVECMCGKKHVFIFHEAKHRNPEVKSYEIIDLEAPGVNR